MTSPGYINLKIKEFERSAIICQGHGAILFSLINKYTLLPLCEPKDNRTNKFNPHSRGPATYTAGQN